MSTAATNASRAGTGEGRVGFEAGGLGGRAERGELVCEAGGLGLGQSGVGWILGTRGGLGWVGVGWGGGNGGGGRHSRVGTAR